METQQIQVVVTTTGITYTLSRRDSRYVLFRSKDQREWEYVTDFESEIEPVIRRLGGVCWIITDEWDKVYA